MTPHKQEYKSGETVTVICDVGYVVNSVSTHETTALLKNFIKKMYFFCLFKTIFGQAERRLGPLHTI